MNRFLRHFVCLLSVGACFWGQLHAQTPAKPVASSCTPDQIAKMARGGMSDSEIQQFCQGAQKPGATSDLRQRFGALESKNWQTHFLQKNAQGQQQPEILLFTVGKETVSVKSSNPNAAYVKMEDLGDAIRFERTEKPYPAVYVLTIKASEITPTALNIVQQYKKVAQYTWKAAP